MESASNYSILLTLCWNKTIPINVSVLFPLRVKDKVIPHVLVAEKEVGVTPEAGHQGTLQDDVTCIMLVDMLSKKCLIILPITSS